MANKFDVNKTFKGKNGDIWMNETLVGTCEKFEAKITPDYSEQKLKGKTYRIPQGYAITGSLTSVKVDRMFTDLLFEAMKNCEVPEVTIVGVETNGEIEERIKFENVSFDELMLISFAEGESRKDEMAFQAVDADYVDRG